MRWILIVALLVGVQSCALFQSAKDKFVSIAKETIIPEYCKGDEELRQYLRDQLTTSKGPLVQVNCENLE